MDYYMKRGEDPHLTLPVTFHIKDGATINDPSFKDFKQYYQQNALEDINMWIVKPGEDTNRGRGIQVAHSMKEIESIVAESDDS